MPKFVYGIVFGEVIVFMCFGIVQLVVSLRAPAKYYQVRTQPNTSRPPPAPRLTRNVLPPLHIYETPNTQHPTPNAPPSAPYLRNTQHPTPNAPPMPMPMPCIYKTGKGVGGCFGKQGRRNVLGFVILTDNVAFRDACAVPVPMPVLCPRWICACASVLGACCRARSRTCG